MEKIRILHTNDLHSHFETFPKIERFLKKAQKDQTVDEVFTFDAGDFMDRSHPLSEATKGQANIELMNRFNYNAITIGNNEGISNSHTVLEGLFDHANFPVVLANLREKDNSMPRWCTPYKIFITKQNTRIAVVGLTAAYPMTYGPNGWNVKLIANTMDNLLPQLEGKYDMLIVVSHIGLTMDRFLAQNYPQISLIVGGHSHDLLENGEKVNKTWITQTGKWGKYVGDIHVNLKDHHVVEIKPTTHPTSKMEELKDDEKYISSLRQKGIDILTKEKIADLPAEFDNNKMRAIEASLDAITDFAKTDIGMLSTGLFLKPFNSGVFTEADLQQALPHPMHVVRSTLKGEDLWRLVMEVEKNRHYLKKFHLVGMSFRGKIFGEIVYKGITVAPESRTVYVNGKEIEPEKFYTIAVLDHYVLIPFFPTLAIVGQNEFLFPQYLRTVVGDYLAKKYPLKENR